jgi:hypothetical protein
VVSEHFPWQTLWAKKFYFCRFFFSKKKKEGREIPEFLVYLCEKFVEKVVYLSSSHKNTQVEKKNRLKRSPGSQDIEVLKSVNFQGFFHGRRHDFFSYLCSI